MSQRAGVAPLPKNRAELTVTVDESARHIDENGFLHVARTNISKAMVCEYYGAELPDPSLEPDRIYFILRPADELEKAAATSNLVPLLSIHTPATAEDMPKEVTIGALGTDGAFVAPYLQNSLVIWPKEDIDGVRNREKYQLSCGYTFDLDMTPGVFEGVRYDGVQRNIVYNHVAIVDEGRCGPDVMVADAIAKREGVNPKEGVAKYGAVTFADPKNKKYPIDTPEHVRAALSYWGQAKNRAKYSPEGQEAIESKIRAAAKKFGIGAAAKDFLPKEAPMKKNNPLPLRAANALRGFLIGKVAADKAPTLQELLGLTKNLTVDRYPKQKDALKGAVLQAFQPRLLTDSNISLEDLPDLLDMIEQAEGEEEGDEGEGMADDAGKACMDMLAAKLTPDEMKQVGDYIAGLKKPQPPAGPLKNEIKPAAPAADEGEEEMVDKKTMDAALAQAKDEGAKLALDRMNALRTAENAVEPFVGKLANLPETPEAIYKLALDAKGVNLTGVAPSSYRDMVAMLPKPNSTLDFAFDAAAASGDEMKDLETLIPGVNRL